MSQKNKTNTKLNAQLGLPCIHECNEYPSIFCWPSNVFSCFQKSWSVFPAVTTPVLIWHIHCAFPAPRLPSSHPPLSTLNCRTPPPFSITISAFTRRLCRTHPTSAHFEWKTPQHPGIQGQDGWIRDALGLEWCAVFWSEFNNNLLELIVNVIEGEPFLVSDLQTSVWDKVLLLKNRLERQRYHLVEDARRISGENGWIRLESCHTHQLGENFLPLHLPFSSTEEKQKQGTVFISDGTWMNKKTMGTVGMLHFVLYRITSDHWSSVSVVFVINHYILFRIALHWLWVIAE